MRKGFLVAAVLILLSVAAFSQIPKVINYQAELRDENNKPLNGSFLMTFTIYDSKAGGIVVWSEYQTVTAEHGFINVYLGNTLPINIKFDKEYWLEIMIENSGNPFPRVPLTTVPYSFHSSTSSESDLAKIAKTVPDGSITQQKLDPNVKMPPGGPAGGDLVGEYPNPLIKDSAITNKKLTIKSVKAININTEKATQGQVLTVGKNGTALWGNDSVKAQKPLLGAGTNDNPLRLDDSPNFIMNNEVIMYKNNNWEGSLITPSNFFSVNQPGANTHKYALTWDNNNQRVKWDIPASSIYKRYPLVGTGLEDDPLKIDTANVYKNYILYYDGSKWTPGIFNEKMIPNNHIPFGKLVPGGINGVLAYTSAGWAPQLIDPTNLKTSNHANNTTDGNALTWNNSLGLMEWRTVSSMASVNTLFPLTGNGTINPVTLANGAENGQVLYWDNTSTTWTLTPNIAPAAGQVLKWNNTLNRIEWGDDDGMILPYVYNTPSAGQELFRLYRTDIAGGANYIVRFVNQTDGRSLYLQGNSAGIFGPDPGDNDEAVLVVNNVNPSYNKTAIKTYGDIRANGKIGAELIASDQYYVLGYPGDPNSATFSVPFNATAPVNLSRDLAINGGVQLANAANNTAGTVRWNGTNFQGYNGSQWINFDSDILWSFNPSENVLASSGDWGIKRFNNTTYGSNASTHINLGFGASATGANLQNYQYATVIGGFDNTAGNSFSIVAGGGSNAATGPNSAILGGTNNTTLGDRSVIAGGSYLTVGDRSFGFRGGIGSNPAAITDVSSETETFHIVDANFHFNYNNTAANFRLDGDNLDYVLFMNPVNDRIGIGTNNPAALLHVNGSLMLAAGASVNDISTDNTLAGADNTTLPTQLAVKDYVDNQIAALANPWTENTVPANYISAIAGGLSTNGATLYGTAANTHINFGFGSSQTGQSGQNYGYATIAGGQDNIASNVYSTIGGGQNNVASGNGSAVMGGIANEARGQRSVVAGGSQLIVGDRSFGFRGGIGSNPVAQLDVSGETETFHIVDANFHFNFSNADADFRLDGDNNDNILFMDASTDRIGIGIDTPLQLFHINGIMKIGSDPDPVAGAFRFNSNNVEVNDGVNGWIRIGNFQLVNGVLKTAQDWGIAKSNATLYGTLARTHVNYGGFETTGSFTGTNSQNKKYCAVMSGSDNTAANDYDVVTGGKGNTATGEACYIGGGINNSANGYNSTITGGTNNFAGGTNSTIGGGGDNTASADGATIAGGIFNIASTSSLNGSSTVGGGALNEATNDYATIAGGLDNTASGLNSFIGGGETNTASGDYSVIPGGSNLTVGDYSFGFRGNLDVGGTANVSGETNTFHIVDAHFHFNSKNQPADFIIDGTSDNVIFAQASSNFVGFGNNSPTSRITLPNTAGAGGEGLANNWATYSDGRVKTEQGSIKYGLDEVMAMNPKEYNHHSSEFRDGQLIISQEYKQNIGLVAQELYEIIPEAVNRPVDDSKELWSVDYDKLIPVLINAVKEQQELIKKQNEQIKALESRLDGIEELKQQYALLQKQYANLEKLVGTLNDFMQKSEFKSVGK